MRAEDLPDPPGAPAPAARTTDLAAEVLAGSRYRARFARTPDDLDAALRLRFEVFNLELGEGLASSFATGRDEDGFDAACHHLLVEEHATQKVVGTYRMLTSAMAEAGAGFYSATLFDLGALPEPVIAQAVELGRACIADGHRNTVVLFLLWQGLARYVAANALRFLFGCCSLTSQDAAEGWAAMRWLEAHDHVHPEIRIAPHPAHACTDDPAAAAPRVNLPRLFRTYLRHGATICSTPAIDRAFGTIDYLALLDVDTLSDLQVRMFFGSGASA